MRRGMVFGVFDGLHEGHKHFLVSAKALCEKLMVVVAPDTIVRELKGKEPREPLSARIEALHSFNAEMLVLAGDLELKSWGIIKKETPDIVFLGYDQSAMEEELTRLGVPFQILKPHEPDQFKSSVINAYTPPNH